MEKINFNSEDFDILKNNVKKVEELMKQYNCVEVNRKNIAKELSENFSNLYYELSALATEFNSLDNHYSEINDYVTDPLKCLELLVKLANVNGEKYELKKMIGSIIPDFSLSKMNNEQKEFWNYFYIISDKEVIDYLSKEDFVYGPKFGKKLEELYKNHSFIILQNFSDYLDTSLLCRFGIYIPVKNLNSSELFANIECFLHNDELDEAVYKFKSFCRENGYDIKGISIDSLYERINSSIDKFNQKNIENKNKGDYLASDKSITYYSEENNVNIFLDFEKPTHCEEHGGAFFYDEEFDEKTRKYFEYDDEEKKSVKTIKKRI